MLQQIGGVLNSVLLIGIGAFAFFCPDKLAGPNGTPAQVQMRQRMLKWSGAVMFLASLALLVLKLSGTT